MATNILMPALSPTISLVMARLDRAIHPPRVCAARKSWIPAGVYPPAALCADRGTGMTKGGV
jgi:hypothetical protein